MKELLKMTWLSDQIRRYYLFGIMIIANGCFDASHNLNTVGEDKFEALEIQEFPADLLLRDTTYVPIYSDIYSETKDTRFKLTATLSLRNTSFKHRIFVGDVDYYNSAGFKARSFLSKPIVLNPMQSVEYVIEEKDTQGGTGANFVITWGSDGENALPIFEGIMISTHGQQGISFSTKGTSISDR